VGKDLPAEGLYVDKLDAIYYMATTVFGYTMREVRCTYCGYSHLDRDCFSVHPHSRHLCAGCGKHFKDTQTGIGNPSCGVREACGVQTRSPKSSTKKLKIKQEDYPGGIQIWGSNAAFIWTGKSTEEQGIHVHAYKNGAQMPKIDETYGTVTIDGITLDPVMVRLYMAQAILPSLRDRITTVVCTSCGEGILSEGDLAFTPATTLRAGRANPQTPAQDGLEPTPTGPRAA
jgi:hypothetical protein